MCKWKVQLLSENITTSITLLKFEFIILECVSFSHQSALYIIFTTIFVLFFLRLFYRIVEVLYIFVLFIPILFCCLYICIYIIIFQLLLLSLFNNFSLDKSLSNHKTYFYSIYLWSRSLLTSHYSRMYKIIIVPCNFQRKYMDLNKNRDIFCI